MPRPLAMRALALGLIIAGLGVAFILRPILLAAASDLPTSVAATSFAPPVSDRAAWDRLLPPDSAAKLIRHAESLLAKPLTPATERAYLAYSRSGSRIEWNRESQERRGRLKWTILAEAIENKGRAIPMLEELIRSLCAEKTWVNPAHDGKLANFRGAVVDIDLSAAALAADLGTVDAVLGQRLSPEVRRLLRENVRARVIDPFIAMASGKRKEFWWMRTTNYWNAVCLAGVAVAGLAIAENDSERAFLVAACDTYSRCYLDGFSPDGFTPEGIGYWNYGFGHYLLLADILDRATDGKTRILDREKIPAVASFGERFAIAPGVYPPFSDVRFGDKADPLVMATAERMVFGFEQEQDTRALVEHRGLVEILATLFPRPTRPRALPVFHQDAGGFRAWFPDAGVIICRPSEWFDGIGAVMKAGDNGEAHNHNDVGSFVVVRGGVTLVTDPGGEEYSARTFSERRYESKVINSWGHPVPVVGGKLQGTGREFSGKFASFRLGELKDTVLLDMTKAYPLPTLLSLTRLLAYDRAGGGATTITDAVAFSRPETFESALITYGRWRLIDANTIRIEDAGKSVDVRIESNGEPFDITAETIDERVHETRRPTRIGIRLKNAVKAARIVMRIS